MDQISKLNAALVSVPQELTIAAANFNLDFSLMKVEAPKEFVGVGDSLSTRRRGDAEEGQTHITARKLGALFESLVPAVPHLYQAYGKRASNISSRSTSQCSTGLDSRIFEGQAGLDGTSLWAAATSGRGAIGVHLLACMLARIWKSHEAISLWVELVDRRKEEILRQYGASNAMEIGSLMAAKQTFSRQQLASWDASARSWLQTADGDRKLQQTQLMLIISNVRLPVNSKKDPYASVIEAWVSGMTAMDRSVQGVDQRVQNGTILLAMSSWHLYPDMEVLLKEVQHIEQHDELIPGSLITITAQTASHSKEGVFWSLPLARMRYYSAPVTAERQIGSKTSRVSIEDFWLIALGAIIAPWGPPNSIAVEGCAFITRLSQVINEPQTSLKWLKYLADAAHKLNNGTELERLQSAKLLRLGLRRCNALLNDTEQTPPIFFGLNKISILLNFLPGTEEKISFLREIGASLGASSDKMLIRYPEVRSPKSRSNHDEGRAKYIYATVLPLEFDFARSNGDSEPALKRQRQETAPVHIRWILSKNPTTSGIMGCNSNCSCADKSVSLLLTADEGVSRDFGTNQIDCPCALSGRGCSPSCHNARDDGAFCLFWDIHHGEISCNGSECGCTVIGGPDCPCEEFGSTCTVRCHMNRIGLSQCHASKRVLQTSRQNLNVGHPCPSYETCPRCALARLSRSVEATGEECSVLSPADVYKADDWSFLVEGDEQAYQLHLGDTEDTAIFLASGTKVHRDPTTGCDLDATIGEIQKVLSYPTFDSKALVKFLSEEVQSSSSTRQQRCSLNALEFATELYSTLPGSTINVEVSDTPLYMAQWAQEVNDSLGKERHWSPPDDPSPKTPPGAPAPPGAFAPPVMSKKEQKRHARSSRRPIHQTNPGRSFTLQPQVLNQPQTLNQRQFSNRPSSPVFPMGHKNPLNSPENKGLGFPPQEPSSPCENKQNLQKSPGVSKQSSTSAVSFACIAMMETGDFNIDPKQLLGVLALSSGDSIFVVSGMISDPHRYDSKQDIKRIFGNLGRSELAFLLPPSKPRMTSFDVKSWHLVNHFQFDGVFENNFRNTSLHLSFTDFELPIDVGHRGLRDTLVVLLESVVSVHDGGNHIGDLDINSMSQSQTVTIAPQCSHHCPVRQSTDKRIPTLVSIDSWVELLDFPDTVGIFRANDNWQARLAATAASLQLGKKVAILPKSPCLQCLQEVDKSQIDVIIA